MICSVRFIWIFKCYIDVVGNTFYFFPIVYFVNIYDATYLIRLSIYQWITSICQSVTNNKYLICLDTKWKTKLLCFFKRFMTWSSSFLISIRFKPWKFSKSCCPLVSIFSTISFFIFHFFPNRRGFFIANIGNLRISLSTISASFPLTFVIGNVKFPLYKDFLLKNWACFLDLQYL